MLVSSLHACLANYFICFSLYAILNFSIALDVQKNSTHMSRTADRKIENSGVKHKENKDTKNLEKKLY